MNTEHHRSNYGNGCPSCDRLMYKERDRKRYYIGYMQAQQLSSEQITSWIKRYLFLAY